MDMFSLTNVQNTENSVKGVKGNAIVVVVLKNAIDLYAKMAKQSIKMDANVIVRKIVGIVKVV